MKKSNAFLLASLAATSFLFHNQEAKAGINDECSIKIPAKLIFFKATAGGAYAIVPDIHPQFNKRGQTVGKNEKRQVASFYPKIKRKHEMC